MSLAASRPEGEAVLFTIGHSNHPLDVFVDLLQMHRIQVLIDVRSQPYSRHAEWFSKRPLASALKSIGLKYIWLGDVLGGRPENPELRHDDGRPDYEKIRASEIFQSGLVQLEAEMATGRTAVMCAEEDPKRCHRSLLIAPAMSARGRRVMHIRRNGRLEDSSGEHAQLDLFPEDGCNV